MGAAKRVKYSFLPGVSAAYMGTARSSEGSAKSSGQPRASAQARVATAAGSSALKPIISASGKVLPEVLVKALKGYTATSFTTKTKDDLLAMLVNTR
jgi:hypothetical protein